MLEMKVYICCKTLSNHMRIQKACLKFRNRTLYLLTRAKQENCWSNKNSRVICAPVTAIVAERIVIAQSNRCCWSDMETITDSSDQWIRNNLNKIVTNRTKIKKGASTQFSKIRAIMQKCSAISAIVMQRNLTPVFTSTIAINSSVETPESNNPLLDSNTVDHWRNSSFLDFLH